MKKIVIIGGGIAGLEVSRLLLQEGFPVTLIEKSSHLGGNIRNYAYLFPDFTPSEEILKNYTSLPGNADLQLLLNTEIEKIDFSSRPYTLFSNDGIAISADSIIIATGYQIFDARLKEEFGYGIYDGVITSVEMEKMIREQHIVTPYGKAPRRIAFIHCVGSRDAKVGNTYCSRLCCITAIKQAIETKKLLPQAEIFCFYIDLRMYGLTFEELYLNAQKEYNIQFVRGRLSETSEMIDKRLIIKAEDTLIGRPLKMMTDMLVLMVGMEASNFSKQFAYHNGLEIGEHGFFKPLNQFNARGKSQKEGIYFAGTSIGPMSVAETIEHAQATALSTISYLKGKEN